MTFCTKTEKAIVKYIWKHKRSQITKAILSKISNAGGILIPNFKLHQRAITIKTVWYWHKNRQEDQLIRIEDPDINVRIYSQLIFDKGAQNTQWRRQPLQQILLGKPNIHM
jgi:uncharacterized protein (DUF736 family)